MLSEIYFERANGELVLIGVAPAEPDEHEPAMAVVHRFCTQHKYQIPYFRMWNEEMKGREMTCVDVGSHTEFFWIDPPLTLFT